MHALLWGAGEGSARVITMLDTNINVAALIDIRHEMIGKIINGLPVLHPDEINNYSFDYIIICNSFGSEVKKILVDDYNIPFHKIIDAFNDEIIDVRRGTLKAISQEIDEKKIVGSVAEVGVYQGDFAHYINLFFPDRKLYLFDTFAGFDKRDILDEISKGVPSCTSSSTPKEKDYLNDDIELVLNKMLYRNMCYIYKGFFPDSAKDVNDEFCFVSLDVDLFAPTYAALFFFYERLVKGGFIMVHDYNTNKFQGVKMAVNQFSKETGISYVPTMDRCGSIVITK